MDAACICESGISSGLASSLLDMNSEIKILQQSVDLQPVLTVKWSNITLHSLLPFWWSSGTWCDVNCGKKNLTSGFGVYLRTPAACSLD